MKINKNQLGIRIITFPIKLAFMILWMITYAIVISFRWLLFGSQELYFGKGFGTGDLSKIVEQNEELIKHFKL